MKALLISLFLVFSTSVFAAESSNYETVVMDRPLSSSSRRIINRAEIERSGAQNVAQLLSQTSGISYVRGAFVPTTLYMRGGDSGHIVVLLDGFPVYDALSDKRSFNVNSINLASIQKIEVIKGSQTALYGGQALAGVIKIETQSFARSNERITAKIKAGNNEKRQAFLDLREKVSDHDLPQVGAFFQRENLPSPILNSAVKYPEQSMAGEASWLRYQDNLGSILLRARLYGEERDIISRNQDAIGFKQKNQHKLVGLNFVGEVERKIPRVSFAYVDSSRSYYHPVNELNTSEFDQTFKSDLILLRLEQPILKNDDFDFSAGGSYAVEKGNIDNVKGQTATYNGRNDSFKQELTGFYSQASWKIFQDLETGAGLRWEKIPGADGFSYQVGMSWEAWKAEVAQGMKAPTLFNLYDYQYGNSSLKPEIGRNISLERKFMIGESSAVSVTGFYAEYSNLIEARSNAGVVKYQNVNESEITGVEGFGQIHVTDKTFLDITTVYQNPIDKGTNKALTRRPYFTASAQITEMWTPKMSSFLSYYFSGERTDIGATSSSRETLASYSLIGLGGQFNASESLQFELNVRNLTDQRFQESYGFYSEGLSVYAGMTFKK